jgi:hypothetical protein
MEGISRPQLPRASTAKLPVVRRLVSEKMFSNSIASPYQSRDSPLLRRNPHYPFPTGELLHQTGERIHNFIKMGIDFT